MQRLRKERSEEGLERVELWVPKGRRDAFREMAAREVQALERARAAGFTRMVLLVPEALADEVAATAEQWRTQAEAAGAVDPDEAVE